MKNIFFCFIICSLFVSSFFSLQSQNSYKYYVDLNDSKNDELKVLLKVPNLKQQSVFFCFPAMVPGTYSVYDFGRFVKNFSVRDKNNNKISFEKIDINRYKIADGSKISEISYVVEDSWDTNDTGEVIFEPAGTKFDFKKHFVLNNQGVFGFFSGLEKLPFEIEITKPENFYPSTGIANLKIGPKKDLLITESYHELVDSPILYALPDTTKIDISGTEILISVVSPNKKITSSFIAKNISEILNAHKNYLGGKLPVNKYAFLFFFTDSITKSGSTGALEHSYSSMYVLFESDSNLISQTVKDVAAHEFFHIVTPLNIHSEEIGNFDFSNPKMSMHLWLYEGMTEYAAHHVQVMNGIIDWDTFFEVIREKTLTAEDYFNDTLSFTKMSRGCLKDYKSQYGNVYEKGALISLCLDILLNHYSAGKYNNRMLISDLSKKYGKNNSFNDEQLFNVIESLTYPEIRKFLNEHVSGNKKLPFKDVFRMVGIKYDSKLVEDEITLGGFEIGYDAESKKIIIESVAEMNEFGKSMGYKEGDYIVSFQGKKVELENASELFYNFIENAKEGDLLNVEVLRKDKRGKLVSKNLSSKVRKMKVTYRNVIQPDPLATDEELGIRNMWLQGSR
ncbi:MAG: peptidase M61 [Bacteroidota bacterium]